MIPRNDTPSMASRKKASAPARALSLSAEHADDPILVHIRAEEYGEARRLIRTEDPLKLGWLLLLACERNIPSLAHRLLRRGVSPNVRCARRMTPLHYAAAHGKRFTIVKMLMRYDVDTNAHDAAGNAPLHSAPRNLQNDLAAILDGG